jgi:chromosome partitioning protein
VCHIEGVPDITSGRETMATTIAICNQKGGVGKTTSTVHLAAALSEMDKVVLLIDADGQANATTYALGEEGADRADEEDSITTNEILTDEAASIANAIEYSDKLKCYVVPAARRLDWSFLALLNKGIEAILEGSVLKRKIHDFEKTLEDRSGLTLDYVLIDTPPSVSWPFLDGIGASEWVILPVEAEKLSVEGVKSFLGTLIQAREQLGVQSKLMGVLPTKVDGRRRSATPAMLDSLRATFGDDLVPEEAMIPISSRLSSNVLEETMVRSSNKAWVAYQNLATWVTKKAETGT